VENTSRDSLLLASCLLMSENRGEEASIYINFLMIQSKDDQELNILLAFLFFEIFENKAELG